MFIVLYSGQPTAGGFHSIEAAEASIDGRYRKFGNIKAHYSIARVVPLRAVTKTINTYEDA